MASAMGKIVWYIKALKGRHVFQEIHEEICAMVTFSWVPNKSKTYLPMKIIFAKMSKEQKLARKRRPSPTRGKQRGQARVSRFQAKYQGPVLIAG